SRGVHAGLLDLRAVLGAGDSWPGGEHENGDTQASTNDTQGSRYASHRLAPLAAVMRQLCCVAWRPFNTTEHRAAGTGVLLKRTNRDATTPLEALICPIALLERRAHSTLPAPAGWGTCECYPPAREPSPRHDRVINQ